MSVVTILHNVAKDPQGRPLGMLDGYQPGHALAPVYRYEQDGDVDLDRVFHIFNVGDDPAFGKVDVHAMAYRSGRNRSLSTGDIVSVTTEDGLTHWWAVGSWGFASVEQPTHLTAVATHGTTPIDLESAPMRLAV